MENCISCKVNESSSSLCGPKKKLSFSSVMKLVLWWLLPDSKWRASYTLPRKLLAKRQTIKQTNNTVWCRPFTAIMLSYFRWWWPGLVSVTHKFKLVSWWADRHFSFSPLKDTGLSSVYQMFCPYTPSPEQNINLWKLDKDNWPLDSGFVQSKRWLWDEIMLWDNMTCIVCIHVSMYVMSWKSPLNFYCFACQSLLLLHQD